MRVALLMSALCVAGCDRSDPAPAQQDQMQFDDGRGATFSQDSLRDWFIDGALTGVPGTETELLGMVGDADSVIRLPSSNAQDPMAFDTIIEVHYPGLIVTLLKIGDTEAVQSVWVADTMFLIGPIRPGTSTTTLFNLLGPPMLPGVRPGYVCGQCVPNQAALFDIVNDTVSAILFTFPGN